LIERAVNTLWHKLGEEFLVVALVCMVFLFHVRSSLVAIISLPVGILTAFIVMYLQGINANIMSLGGIAITIGAMIDGAIVMIENMHKHMERTPLTRENRWRIVADAASEVGPALFFSLLIITVSFMPVFTLEAQEGRMFAPWLSPRRTPWPPPLLWRLRWCRFSWAISSAAGLCPSTVTR